MALQELDAARRRRRVLFRLRARRAGVGHQRVAELDPRDQQPRKGVAVERDAGHMRAVLVVAGEIDLFDRGLELVRLQVGQQLLDLGGLRAVDVRLQIGEALGARFHRRQLGLQFQRDRLQLGARRVRVLVESDQQRPGLRVAQHLLAEQGRIDAAVPHRDGHRRIRAVARQRDVARRPDVRLGGLVRRQVSAVRLDQRLLQGQPQHQRETRVDHARREVGAERAGLVDDGLQHVTHIAEHQRLADQFGAGLGLADAVGDDRVGHRLQRFADAPADVLAIGLGARAACRLARLDHGARLQTGQQLVGGLVLQRADVLDARQRCRVLAFEHVELQQRAEQLPLHRFVSDVVSGKD